MSAPSRFYIDLLSETRVGVRHESSWGSYFNDPQIHIRNTLNADEVALFGYVTTGFRLAYDSGKATTRRTSKMARFKYTAGERAVAVIGALAGKSLDEINAQLRADRRRDGGELKELNAESYKMLLREYAPKIDPTGSQNIWSKAWDHITAPKTMGEL